MPSPGSVRVLIPAKKAVTTQVYSNPFWPYIPVMSFIHYYCIIITFSRNSISKIANLNILGLTISEFFNSMSATENGFPFDAFGLIPLLVPTLLTVSVLSTVFQVYLTCALLIRK